MKHHSENQVESIKFDARHDFRNKNFLYLRELNNRLGDALNALEVIIELREIYSKEFDRCAVIEEQSILQGKIK